jgi:hypothetical protein
MASAIEATTRKNLHPVDYFKIVEALHGSSHAKMDFWPLEACIILYGMGQHIVHMPINCMYGM